MNASFDQAIVDVAEVGGFKVLGHLKNGFNDSLQVFLRLHFLVLVQLCAAPSVQMIPSLSGISMDLITFLGSQIMRLLSLGRRSGCLSAFMSFCNFR
jgi:hypothetical protein